MPTDNPPHLRYEIRVSQHLIGHPPYERVVATAEEIQTARVIREALTKVYVPHLVLFDTHLATYV